MWFIIIIITIIVVILEQIYLSAGEGISDLSDINHAHAPVSLLFHQKANLRIMSIKKGIL